MASGGYTGPAWPIQRHLRPTFRGEGPGAFGQLFFGVRAIKEYVRDEFDKAVVRAPERKSLSQAAG
jgi:hypothetical protein